MVRNITAGSHGTRAVAKSLHPDLVLAWTFETSKATQSDTPSSTASHLLITHTVPLTMDQAFKHRSLEQGRVIVIHTSTLPLDSKPQRSGYGLCSSSLYFPYFHPSI